MTVKMDGPISGQSLTMEPGNSPWEQPALYDKPEQVLAFYMEKFSDEEILDQTLFILERGFPLSVLVESMTTNGVMEGVHTLDVSVLIAPVLHEFILNMARSADINVNEDDEPSQEEKAKERDKQRLLMLLEDLEPNGDDEELEGDLDEEVEEEESPLNGLIKRRE